MSGTVEAYERNKHADTHRETFGKEKDTSMYIFLLQIV